MPLSCCSAARRTAPLISSLVVLRLATNLRSTTDTFGVGTRIETPSSLPSSSGSTRPTALAAPVVVGIIDSAADRVVHHLGERRQAVGGAGGIGDHEMFTGQLVVVDAVDDGEVGIVGRRG